MHVLVIDYGMSNLGSIRRALEECGASVVVSDDPRDIQNASHIVLPGVGAFGDGMRNLNDQGWTEKLRQTVREDGIPLLGICLGMQLLADKGHEGGEHAGLGLVPGEVRRFVATADHERIPHVGWNEIKRTADSPLLDNIGDGTDFYFVHSYHFVAGEQRCVLATTPYCGTFHAVVAKDNVFGVQFHPEKSGPMGFRLLSNFLNFWQVEA
ncbi:imidazole glycerol phosphate synthase subunit HisH [Anaeroselena agilis]|uniref:Imidazole glycerol phosphate synthase subunit HisH n=1 Tax=Anaeroselena agilis TaxID=3063788 RepID=A0ABU3P4C0_9FIRM|nr:imidazole glycerol phosphate synthase subunit HisH [Selenomonadales bacterium 4137-cl]